jgi:hemolysin III
MQQALEETTRASTPENSAQEHAPTLAEEVVHAITHGLGAVLAIALLALLVSEASTLLHRASASVFGLSLISVYVASTVYHALPARWQRAKAFLRILDHAAIHLLIAGTYTPFAIVAVGGKVGAGLAIVSWVVAGFGVIVETTPLRHSSRLSIATYLGAGWLGALSLPFLWSVTPWSTLAWLLGGGLAYTAGVPFFLREKPWMHALWHGFVLVGSLCHALGVAAVVLP